MHHSSRRRLNGRMGKVKGGWEKAGSRGSGHYWRRRGREGGGQLRIRVEEANRGRLKRKEAVNISRLYMAEW